MRVVLGKALAMSRPVRTKESLARRSRQQVMSEVDQAENGQVDMRTRYLAHCGHAHGDQGLARLQVRSGNKDAIQRNSWATAAGPARFEARRCTRSDILHLMRETRPDDAAGSSK